MANSGSANRITVRLALLGAVIAAVVWLWKLDVASPEESNPYQAAVRRAADETWKAYRRHAWGKDIYHPISGTGENIHNDPMGWIIVDSLDTLMLMKLEEHVEAARDWVLNTLTYDMDVPTSVFETTIRMLGGLLSAYYLSNDTAYLDKAKDLADRIMPAFNSPSGLPPAQVNLRSGAGPEAFNVASSTAEVATLQLEFKYLAEITGEEKYWRAVEKIMASLDMNRPVGGLVPIYVDPQSGKFTSREVRLGSRGDSYYEYLIKQYLQTNQTEVVYKELYDESVDGTEKYLVRHSKPNNLLFIGERPSGVDNHFSPKMDHLVCFAGGMYAIGATGGKTLAEAKKTGWTSRQARDFEFAEGITESCVQMYLQTETGISPEIVVFNAEQGSTSDFYIKPADTHNLQRPETVESLFILWRLTGNIKYREWGWEIFKSFEKYTKVPGKRGYCCLADVTNKNAPKIDNMESFWMAETLKYLYLLFDDNNTWPLDKVVFNTEAHPFPVFDPSFSTGWEREHLL